MTKKTQNDTMRFFFTSDLWLCRNNIIDILDRPFSSIEEMDSTIIENWNTTVTDNDVVFILGNVIYDSTKIQNILTNLNGTKVLMLSETDRHVFRVDSVYIDELTSIVDIYELDECTKANDLAMYKNFGFLTSEEITNSVIHIAEYYRPEIIILKNSIVDMSKYGIVLSLYPLLEWNSKELGTINIHGGMTPSSTDLNKDCRISVRTDFWNYTPIELTEICNLVEQLKTN